MHMGTSPRGWQNHELSLYMEILRMEEVPLLASRLAGAQTVRFGSICLISHPRVSCIVICGQIA